MVVMLAVQYAGIYTSVSLQRQGIVGVNLETGATEVLPTDALELVSLADVKQMMEETDAEDSGKPEAKI
jgi:hypothetical protein